MGFQTAQDSQNLTELEQKHVPVIEVSHKEGDQYSVLVKIGEVAHPMEEEHYIEWIEIVSGDKIQERKNLSLTDDPQARFEAEIGKGETLEAHCQCNVHGSWKNQLTI